MIWSVYGRGLDQVVWRNMKIRCLAVGTKMPGWVYQGVEEYVKRMPRDFSLEFVEIAASQRSKNSDTKRIKKIEGQAILSALKPNERLITLDLKGQNWDTVRLADEATHWRQEGTNIALAIGGPDGLDEAVLNHAYKSWCLSPLTLPHPLVRILIAEQIYRAWSLMNNHPYHK